MAKDAQTTRKRKWLKIMIFQLVFVIVVLAVIFVIADSDLNLPFRYALF